MCCMERKYPAKVKDELGHLTASDFGLVRSWAPFTRQAQEQAKRERERQRAEERLKQREATVVISEFIGPGV